MNDDRQPFRVTDDLEDAPWGAVIQSEDGWWHRIDMWWYPISPEEASKILEKQIEEDRARDARYSRSKSNRTL